MAIPVFVGAGTGVVVTTGSGTVSKTSCTAGNFIILHVLIDGTDALSLGTITNVENLAGTDNNITNPTTGNGDVGSPAAAVHTWRCGRAMADGTCSVGVSTVSGTDIYARLYEFSGVHAGTASSDVLEEGAESLPFNMASISQIGTGTTVTAPTVETNGADRLAVGLIAVNDDNHLQLTDISGESGGTWTYPVTAFGSATGTDGAIAIITAAMSAAGTISGGTDAMDSDAWAATGFALIPPAAAATIGIRSQYLDFDYSR